MRGGTASAVPPLFLSLPRYREEYRGIAKTEEDVLSLALFPQVASAFLAEREKPAAAEASGKPEAIRELYVEYREG